MKNLLSIGIRLVIWLAVIGGGFYYYQTYATPCARPLAYSMGSFDSRFGLSQENFLKAVDEAVSMWEKAIDKDLFVKEDSGGIKLNLIYDQRQANTLRLQQLGSSISESEESYNELKATYNSLNAQYDRDKAALESKITTYQTRKKAYESEVASWNRKGGAPKSEYERLEAERVALNAMVNEINKAQDALNLLVQKINATAGSLNQLAHNLNINVSTYNTVGKSQGSEFEEGLYKSDASGKEIDIFQFENRTKLVRVLAHEFGHALGLEHVEDPKAIMYMVNQGATATLTAADITALKTLCHL